MILMDDVIEILAELFNAYDVQIFYWDEDFEYNPKKKIIYAPEDAGGVFAIMGIAHEFMHHKQNIDKRWMSEDEAGDYKIHIIVASVDERSQWLLRMPDIEIEANAFCKLFIERLLEFNFINGFLDDEGRKIALRAVRDYLEIAKPHPDNESKVKEIKAKEKSLHAKLKGELSVKIDDLIFKRARTRPENRKFKIKVLS